MSRGPPSLWHDAVRQLHTLASGSGPSTIELSELNAQDRQMLHILCTKLNLKSKSSGSDDQRIMRVWRKGERMVTAATPTVEHPPSFRIQQRLRSRSPHAASTRPRAGTGDAYGAVVPMRCQSCSVEAHRCLRCNDTWVCRRMGWYKSKKTTLCHLCSWRDWKEFGNSEFDRRACEHHLCSTCLATFPVEIPIPSDSELPPKQSGASSSGDAVPLPSDTVLSEVVLAKCIQGDLNTNLDRLCPLESEAFLTHLYSTAARGIMAKDAEISVDGLLDLCQRSPPHCFRKTAFRRGLMGPTEKRGKKSKRMRWRRTAGTADEDISVNQRFGLLEGETISRWCPAQAQVKHLIHSLRERPDNMSPHHLSIATWNSGPSRSDRGAIEFYRANSKHRILSQEFDHDCEEGNTSTMQKAALTRCGFVLAGAYGGCMVGFRKHLFKSARTLWSESQKGYMQAVIVRDDLLTSLLGKDYLVLGSVHFHNDRIKKPVAGPRLVESWMSAVEQYHCDLFGFDANQGLIKLMKRMRGFVIVPGIDRDCVGFGVPTDSAFTDWKKTRRNLITDLPEFTLASSDQATHFVCMCTFRANKIRKRNEETRKKAKRRQDAARKARRLDAKMAAKPST